VTTTPGSHAALSVLWQRQSVWSQVAGQLKATIGRARVGVLVLAISGAALGTASAQTVGHLVTVGRVLAAASAVAMVGAAFLGRAASPRLVRDWTRARSISEAMKADAYTYLAGVAPFHDARRDRILLDRLAELSDCATDLTRYIAGVTPIPRGLPAVSDVDSYAAVRVAGQISGYYRPRALGLTRRIIWFKRGEVVGALAAAVLGAVVGAFPSTALTAWIGVLTTAGTAVTAHAAASRYEYQQIEFSRTADELERLLVARAAATGDATRDDDFVTRCEQIISIQNEAWMAKLPYTDHDGGA
jgi:hypothetical protein